MVKENIDAIEFELTEISKKLRKIKSKLKKCPISNCLLQQAIGDWISASIKNIDKISLALCLSTQEKRNEVN